MAALEVKWRRRPKLREPIEVLPQQYFHVRVVAHQAGAVKAEKELRLACRTPQLKVLWHRDA